MDINSKPGEIAATNQPIHQLRSMLEFSLQTPVLDQTGLTDRFDFALRWRHLPIENSHSHEQDPNVIRLKEALRAQLGLELVPSEEPIEMLVVKRAR